MNQSGIPETVASVISTFPIDIQGMFWANIGLIGGMAATKDIGERLEKELRESCPVEWEVGLYEAEE